MPLSLGHNDKGIKQNEKIMKPCLLLYFLVLLKNSSKKSICGWF